MRIPRTLAFCCALILLGSAPALSQVGKDKKQPPPKTDPPKTGKQTKKGTSKGTASKRTTDRPPASQPDDSRAPTPAIPKAGTVVRNQMGMEFVYVPAGSFMMGSESGEAHEKPVHRVTINNGFYMGRYEVTQAQWQAVMGSNPSGFKGDNLPVETVSWNDAQEFIGGLNSREDGYTYRLPTEAEWEYAARAGTTTTYYWGEDVIEACLYANVADQARKAKHADWTIIECRDGYAETSPVGSFQPNAFGLYDMTGNVFEWCEDWYHGNYDGAPTDGSAWLSGGEQIARVHRGGSRYNDADYLRLADRSRYKPSVRYDHVGFRLVAVAR